MSHLNLISSLALNRGPDGGGVRKEDAASAFAEIAGFLHKVTAASQLRAEQRWQLIIYWAFRK